MLAYDAYVVPLLPKCILLALLSWLPIFCFPVYMLLLKSEEQHFAGFHVDDSEVTLNVCLGNQFSGGELFFRGVRCDNHVNTETQPEVCLLLCRLGKIILGLIIYIYLHYIFQHVFEFNFKLRRGNSNVRQLIIHILCSKWFSGLLSPFLKS